MLTKTILILSGFVCVGCVFVWALCRASGRSDEIIDRAFEELKREEAEREARPK
jgi:hypothetical protein